MMRGKILDIYALIFHPDHRSGLPVRPVSISVLMSTYGNCPYVGELRRSLARQIPPFTLIERSDDEPNHLGINGSIRSMLESVPPACGYIAFCDQDDVWLPSKLEKLLAAMLEAEERMRGPILVHCDAVVTNADLGMIRRRFIGRWARKDDLFGSLMFNKVQGASMLINRDLLTLVESLPCGETLYDRYIHLMAETVGRRIFVDEPLMLYRQHASNAVGANDAFRKINFHFLNDGDLRMARENALFFRSNRSMLSEKNKKILDDYISFVTTRSPIKRLKFICRYLRGYPTAFVKKALKIFLP